MTKNQIVEKYNSLFEKSINSESELRELITLLNVFEAEIGEHAAWLQIDVTRDTADTQKNEAFAFFITEIEPLIKEKSFDLYKKIVSSAFFDVLYSGENIPYLRQMKGGLDLYRQENIALQSQESLLEQEFGSIAGAMGITYHEQEYTLQQASKFLENKEPKIREEVYFLIQNRRLQDKENLFALFFKLLKLRHQIALNAGFENYRDFKFKALGRYDYDAQACFDFHENVKKHFLPLWNQILENKKKALGLASLRPWDLESPMPNENELKPFENGSELIEKSISLFQKMDPSFAQYLSTMQEMQRLDLDSRKNKASGGYNCPLPLSGVPFIFMNSAGTLDDLITMMHESGHAFHSFLSHTLPWNGHKEYPMEMAELASMSMELMSMDFWSTFFTETEDLQNAKLKELERVISVLPWVATIDKFQHWIYTHPLCTHQELSQAWVEIHKEFSPQAIDWSGLDMYRENLWQKQLHLFEVPFYYIEYGIAQIGAVAMWMNYKKEASKTLDNYKHALSLGYTQTLPQLYNTAGITFDFGNEKMKELSAFLSSELEKNLA